MIEPMYTLKPQNIVDVLPHPAFLLDFEGSIICANTAAKQLFGMRPEKHNFFKLIKQPNARKCIMKAITTNSLVTCNLELHLQTPRTYAASTAVLIPNTDENGVLLFTLNDVSAAIDAEKSRSIFVANVSHELRSPLTSLMGIVETLQGPARNDESARERFLDIMQRETRRMSRLVGDLLSLSKLEAKEHLAPEGNVQIFELIQRVTAVLSESTSAYKDRVNIHAQKNLPVIKGDQDELTEVFQNLIENALKYSHPHTPVDITITHMNGKVTIGIKDQSEGIAAKHLPRLTERFYRADKGRSRDMGGTGLGLAITKHILNRHRANFLIESEIGVGTSIVVAFTK